MDLSRTKLLGYLRKMYLIRYFEETASDLYGRGLVHGTMHLSIGQEASAVGAIAALREDDCIFSTHRGHGHCIAKGADINRMMAEFLGKETGYCRGRGGSMHIADLAGGNFGANGIVGGGIGMAAGVALSIQMRGADQVVMGFFGDGAANQGIFHEALNLASIWKLPVVYVCENNQYAISMSVRRATCVENLADRASAYGMPGVTVDGNDLLAVLQVTQSAVERARVGRGPTLVECLTYRWLGHSKSDANVYRTQEEIDSWKAKCPIEHLRSWLLEQKIVADPAELDAIAGPAHDIIAAAVEYAMNSPDPSVETLLEGVYAP